MSSDQNTISSSEGKENCDVVIKNEYFPWSNKKPTNVSIENEITTYLSKSQKKCLLFLNETPSIKNVFIKYNTPLPSNTPVEIIFTVGSAVLTKNRSRMTDDNFEKVMIFKCNKQLFI